MFTAFFDLNRDGEIDGAELAFLDQVIRSDFNDDEDEDESSGED